MDWVRPTPKLSEDEDLGKDWVRNAGYTTCRETREFGSAKHIESVESHSRSLRPTRYLEQPLLSVQKRLYHTFIAPA